MSKISKEGYEQLTVIKNALNSMYDKLDRTVYVETQGKVKNIEEKYIQTNVFNSVKDEFEAISNIVSDASTWEEVV
jgi:hypothetical protein|tara:strand:+ start:3680 stop:3907 length:228 start_codon:yes stop_codon:yes gene_type:complete